MVFLEDAVKCWYCDGRIMGEGNSCNKDEDGVEVSCQSEDSSGEHYGNSCAIAHTGKLNAVLHLISNNTTNNVQCIMLEPY